MDSVDRAADEMATMRLRSSVLKETVNEFIGWGDQFAEGTPQRAHYFELALQLAAISGEYAGLLARRRSQLGFGE